MKTKTFIFSSLIIVMMAGLCCLLLFHQSSDQFIEKNTEVLSSSESYSLGDCFFKSRSGNTPELALFCDPETDEYELHECPELSLGYPSMRKGKCVFE